MAFRASAERSTGPPKAATCQGGLHASTRMRPPGGSSGGHAGAGGRHARLVLVPVSNRRFLVTTDHGDVVVEVREGATGLDADLLSLAMADEAAAEELPVATPLRAFAAKMVDIIEAQGLGEFGGGERMREMMVREKATSELRRIERFARDHGRG